MAQAIRIDKEWIANGNQHYKGYYIKYNGDGTFTAVNESDRFDYYIRESLAKCRTAIDNQYTQSI